MEGYKEIRGRIHEIDAYTTEHELREILQHILFVCEDNIKNEPTSTVQSES